MCGICGIATPDGQADVEALRAMSRQLTHRGPDSAGEHVDREVALGARRLSIIDLAGGDQPIANEDGSVVVVQNGELYNYPELREELLLKIIACMTTTEGMGLLLCCRRLSNLARPSVFQKRQKEVRIFVCILLCSGYATIQGLAAIWAQHRPPRRLWGSW